MDAATLMEGAAGVAPHPESRAATAAAWAALDTPQEWQVFSHQLPDGLWESHLSVNGLRCGTCVLAVEAALARLPGVQQVQLNGASGTVRLRWSAPQGRPSQWCEAVQRAGYSLLPAGDLRAQQVRQRSQRMLLWRWLVAGFCMMQVMMYAAPAYWATPGDITPQDIALLRWASWVLTLPVVLFCCQPFFTSAWRDLRHGRIGMDVPVALGIVVAFGASSAATFEPAGPLGAEVWFDSVTMFVFFLLSGRLLEERLRARSTGALEALLHQLPATVERQRPDGSFERVAVRRLVAGDVVRVLPGEVIPADGRVLAGESRVDEALLTGESRPLLRRAGDAVVAGSHCLNGSLQLRVERIGADTRFAAIAQLMEEAAGHKPRLARAADRIAGPFLLLVLVAAAAAALWWWPQGPAQAIGVAVAVLIVTCPCALSLATPAASLAAAAALARRGVLVRRLDAFERGACIDTVVFDKTGTLTEDRQQAQLQAWRAGSESAGVLALAGGLAAQSLHPAARAVASLAGPGAWPAQDVTEVPGQGVQGRVHGPDGSVQALRLGSAAFCGAPDSGASQVHLADGQGWLASFSLDEALRFDAQAAVAALRGQGVDVQMLSGDRQLPVAQLAQRAGIAQADGAQSPEAKLEHLRGLQARGRRVAMVGDGLNDGPVLACADLSIAMGSAVPLAQLRCDVVVQGNQLALVPALLRQARRTRAVVRQNLAWAGLYNAVCVPLALIGAMPPWLAGLGMAASSLLVVANSARLARLKEG